MDAAATAAAAQAPPAKRGRGRPRKQAAASGSSSGAATGQPLAGGAGDPALLRQSPMEAMPFLDRALGVLDMGEAARRADARVRPQLLQMSLEHFLLMPSAGSKRWGSLMLLGTSKRWGSGPCTCCLLLEHHVQCHHAGGRVRLLQSRHGNCAAASVILQQLQCIHLEQTHPAYLRCHGDESSCLTLRAAASGRGQLAGGGGSGLGGCGCGQGLPAGGAAAAGRVCSRCGRCCARRLLHRLPERPGEQDSLLHRPGWGMLSAQPADWLMSWFCSVCIEPVVLHSSCQTSSGERATWHDEWLPLRAESRGGLEDGALHHPQPHDHVPHRPRSRPGLRQPDFLVCLSSTFRAVSFCHHCDLAAQGIWPPTYHSRCLQLVHTGAVVGHSTRQGALSHQHFRCVLELQVDQVRVGWADVQARGVPEQDAVEVYLRQSGLLDWQYDALVDAPDTEQEDPLLRQQRM